MDLSPSKVQSSNVPEQLGRYEVISQLGVGGMARVYLAIQPSSVAVKLVVVKRLLAEFADDPAFVDMFIDESRIAVRMSHPNVIHTYEAVSDGTENFIVMEFLEGKTLAQVLRAMGRDKVALGLQLWIHCQVLAGLEYAHELQDFDGTPLEIVHRDVSPSNIFLTRTGEVKLVDFGIGKISGALAETQQGMVKGKIGYASPEQCLGKNVDGRSDIYAVGVMLWEAIAGRRRAVGETAHASIQARIQNVEADIAVVCPGVAPELARIVRRALAFNPDKRYPTAAAFRTELRQYASSAGFLQGTSELEGLISSNFGHEMAELRRLIDEQVGSVRLRSAHGPNSSVRRSGPPRGHDTHPEPLEFDVGSAGSRGRARWLLLLVPALVVAGLLVASIVLLWRAQNVVAAIAVPSAAALNAGPNANAKSSNALPSLPGEHSLPIATNISQGGAAPLASRDKQHRADRLLRGRAVPVSEPRTTAPSAYGASPALTRTPAPSPSLEPGSDLRSNSVIAAPPRRGVDDQDPYR